MAPSISVYHSSSDSGHSVETCRRFEEEGEEEEEDRLSGFDGFYAPLIQTHFYPVHMALSILPRSGYDSTEPVHQLNPKILLGSRNGL